MRLEMSEFKELRLIPDWPRIRQLVAKKLGKSEDEVQSMRESGDSLDQVELAMTIEEVLGARLPR
jgi:acyl carrier protein